MQIPHGSVRLCRAPRIAQGGVLGGEEEGQRRWWQGRQRGKPRAHPGHAFDPDAAGQGARSIDTLWCACGTYSADGATDYPARDGEARRRGESFGAVARIWRHSDGPGSPRRGEECVGLIGFGFGFGLGSSRLTRRLRGLLFAPRNALAIFIALRPLSDTHGFSLHIPFNPVSSGETERKQIYRNAMHHELAEMRESRKAHAIDMLKARVVSARVITGETRYALYAATTRTLTFQQLVFFGSAPSGCVRQALLNGV